MELTTKLKHPVLSGCVFLPGISSEIVIEEGHQGILQAKVFGHEILGNIICLCPEG